MDYLAIDKYVKKYSTRRDLIGAYTTVANLLVLYHTLPYPTLPDHHHDVLWRNSSTSTVENASAINTLCLGEAERKKRPTATPAAFQVAPCGPEGNRPSELGQPHGQTDMTLMRH